MPLQQQRPSFIRNLTDSHIEVFGADLLTQIQIPPNGEDPDAARRRLAELLAAAAGGKREPLEQLRARFIRRLHLASDDFAATAGLRVAEAALTLVPRPDGVWDMGHQARVEPRRRWWRRRSRD
jgi:hypothetical protein